VQGAGSIRHREDNAGFVMPARFSGNTADHQIEVVGAQLRAMMPWIAKDRKVNKKEN
jgi:ketol-acid reductoisomerase